MGRTYRRNPDDSYSYRGKSLREKRQRGGTRSNWDDYDPKNNKKKKKNEFLLDEPTYRENYDD